MTRSQTAASADVPGKRHPEQPTSSPQVVLFPFQISSAARVLTLSNPANRKPCRYLFCPEKGFYEFTRIAAPKSAPRSWLLARPNTTSKTAEKGANTPIGRWENGDRPSAPLTEDGVQVKAQDTNNSAASKVHSGYVLKDSSLLVTTPFDPLFFLLPALDPNGENASSTRQAPGKALFLAASDYYDRLQEMSPQFSFALSQTSMERVLEARIRKVCDYVEAGDETMFRLNEKKLIHELLRKALNVLGKDKTASTLPASVESKFVSRALESPVQNVLHEKEDRAENEAPSQQSQGKSENKEKPPKTDADSLDVGNGSESMASAVNHLMRLHTAVQFIVERYLPANLAEKMHVALAGRVELPKDLGGSIDFTPLHTHLEHLSKSRAEALASRSRDDFACKRSHGSMSAADEEDMLAREEKRRKKQEDDEEAKKRRANESRAMRDLKKVNVNGMKKMSDFFNKKAVPSK